jgi:hypothetical protein
MSTEEDLGKEDSTSSDRRAYMRSIRYNQKTTPCIKWQEKLRETQLSVRVHMSPRISSRVFDTSLG